MPASSFANARSNTKRHAQFSGTQMHRVLRHVSLEVISHVSDAVLDVTITSSTPSTIDYETYSVSKATKVISRRTEVDVPENGIPFDRTT